MTFEALQINAFMDRYCFFRRQYVMMKAKEDGSGVMVTHMDYPYTTKQVWEHLNGNMSLCVFAGPKNTSFLSIDIDMRSPEVIHCVLDTIVDLGIPRDKIYVSDSGSKGYHVDIFFAGSIYNWKAKELYELIIYFGKLNPRKVEYRPTAKQAIKLPLGVHQKTGRRCWFVDRDTLEPIEDADYICRTEKIDLYIIDDILKNGNRRRYDILFEERQQETPAQSKKRVRKQSSVSTIRIDEPGTRVKRMIEEALRLYRAGGDFYNIRNGLEKWLLAQDPSMYKDPWDECLRNINDIAAWVMKKGRRQELGDDPNHDYHEKTRIYASDARRIVLAPTKAARLLAFFITVFCDRYGFCGFGVRRLCDSIGVKSNKTVITAGNDIVDLGLFWRAKGGYKNIHNVLKAVTNKYKFPLDYVREGEYIEIDGLVTADNIYELYINTVAALCSDDELSGTLTAPELVDVRNARVLLNGRKQSKDD